MYNKLFETLEPKEQNAVKFAFELVDKKPIYNNYTLVNFMIKMAHEMGISVCIEGVETKEELDCVSVLSPDFIQGYYYGKPVDEDTFYKMHLGA